MSSEQMLVYTKPNCPACVALKAKLTAQGHAYTEINVGQDAQALAFLKSKGHRSVPVVYLAEDNEPVKYLQF